MLVGGFVGLLFYLLLQFSLLFINLYKNYHHDEQHFVTLNFVWSVGGFVRLSISFWFYVMLTTSELFVRFY